MVTETPTMEREKSPLRYLHDTQVSLEKFRIQLGNRVSAIARGVDDAERPVPEAYDRVRVLAEQMETEIDKAIKDELASWPVWDQWLRHVKGIGPSLAGQMLALLLPPLPDKGPSSWYKAAGLSPEVRPDGLHRLPRARKGEGKITYHPWLRRCLYNVATSFVRNGGYYRTAYERQKARVLENAQRDPDQWPPHRIDSTARWIVVKLFLSHLWDAWCAAEGITSRGPYGLTTLPDGTKVIRVVLADGAHQDHAFVERPLPTEGGGKI